MAKEFGYQVICLPSRGGELQDCRSAARKRRLLAVWADWYGFKMEAYDAIPENAALIHNQGACVVIHSDDENGIQRLNQEAAKAQADGRRMGIEIADADVISWITLNRRARHGHRRNDRQPRNWQDGRCGAVERRSAVHLFAARNVWIDGAMMYDMQRSCHAPGQRFRAGPAGRRRREMNAS